MRSVVTIGGGTGQFTLLTGLKKFPVRLTAVVSMADDGGSTGVLRDELGVLPPGDIRQCLVALAEADSVMRELFSYRFEQGGMRGHNFGNLFLSALEKLTGSFEEAVRVSGSVLATRGTVIPVTTTPISLVNDAAEGGRGEKAVNDRPVRDPAALRLEPAAFANPRAVEAIEQADLIVIGPGNLYCSIIPNLLVRGVAEAVRRSPATVVYNCNLMTKAGHTDGFGVDDFVRSIERHIGEGRIDFVTFNEAAPDADLVARYAEEGTPVRAPSVPDRRHLAADLLSRSAPVERPGDPLRRTLIRHDPDALAALIVRECLKGV